MAELNSSPPIRLEAVATRALLDEKERGRWVGDDRIVYRECQKNHAAISGGHAIDGCGEFMPLGGDGTPESLRCAACDCHRNFHRKEVIDSVVGIGMGVGGGGGSSGAAYPQTLCDCQRSRKERKKLAHSSPSAMAVVHVVREVGGGPNSGRSGDTPLLLPAATTNVMGSLPGTGDSEGIYPGTDRDGCSAKRFRTKFTSDQKEKMAAFAERIGWKINKMDEQDVRNFCAEIGVQKHVLKVWMHNNKKTFRTLKME